MKHRLRTCGLQRLLYIIWKLIMFQWNWLLSRAQPLLFRQVWYTMIPLICWSLPTHHWPSSWKIHSSKCNRKLPGGISSNWFRSKFNLLDRSWFLATGFFEVTMTKHRKHVLGDMDWWKKSQTTTWHVWNPVNKDIFSISTGTGFLPSTVSPAYLLVPNHPTPRKSGSTQRGGILHRGFGN